MKTCCEIYGGRHKLEEEKTTKLALQELMSQEVHDHAQDRQETRTEKNRYTDSIRKTVMKLQGEGNVLATRCSQVIKIVAQNMLNLDFQDSQLPCVQTSLNIADEGHVLSKIQATEKMLETQNFTLHTDGTSRGGEKNSRSADHFGQW